MKRYKVKCMSFASDPLTLLRTPISAILSLCQKLITQLFFIPSSEFNAYLKQIKVILSAVKKYRIFSLVTNTIHMFFTVANRGCFDNVGLNFFQKGSGMHRSCLTLRYGGTHVK